MALKGPVMQEWTFDLPFMQQTVLLTAIRGPDGIDKYHPVKFLLRWYRRCILRSSLEGGRVITTPNDPGGGSFMGPSFTEKYDLWQERMGSITGEYIATLDAIPHHFHLHLMHAAEIVGYKHPDDIIRPWWCALYYRFASDMHLHPETKDELDRRLGDTRAGWLERADPATVK